jgi:hypothetical protein
VKSVFVADVEHTNEYGRPITFDNYSAMVFGPVPENTYDAIKPEFKFFKRNFGIEGPLWTVTPAPQISRRSLVYSDPQRHPNLRVLSPSDVECITKAMRTVQRLGFKRTSDWTHDHPAYKTAWENRGEKGSSPMYFEHLIDGDDEDDLMSDLVHASRHSL